MSQISYYENLVVSFEAGANLLKNRFVKMSSGKVVYCGAGQNAIGVNKFEVDSGRMASVWADGYIPVEVGSGGVTEGALVVSDANGKAVLASTLEVDGTGTPVTADAASPAFTGSVLGERILGTAIEAGSEDDVVIIKLAL